MMQLHNYRDRARPYAQILDAACLRHKYSQLRAFTQIAAESAWDPTVASSVGAIGLAQIMPATAAAWGVDPHEPASAIDGLVRNMAAYTRTYQQAIATGVMRGTSFSLALAAYNAGPGAVEKYEGIPAYPETERYVATITETVRHALPYWTAFWRDLLGA